MERSLGTNTQGTANTGLRSSVARLRSRGAATGVESPSALSVCHRGGWRGDERKGGLRMTRKDSGDRPLIDGARFDAARSQVRRDGVQHEIAPATVNRCRPEVIPVGERRRAGEAE